MSNDKKMGLLMVITTVVIVVAIMLLGRSTKAEPTPMHHSELKRKVLLTTTQDFSIEVPEGRELHYVIRCYDVDTGKLTKQVWSHNTWEVDEENVRYFDADLNRKVKFIPKDERCNIVEPLNISNDYSLVVIEK